MDYLSLLIGLAGLWFGTEVTIRGAVSVASKLGVSEFIVGAAILSIGSDLPELAIAVDGAIKNLHTMDTSDVVVGTAVGSSLGQIGLVLGVAALFSYLTLPKSIVYRHGAMLLGSVVLLGIFGTDGVVTKTEGIALLTVYVIYFTELFGDRRQAHSTGEAPAEIGSIRAWGYMFFGLGVVVVSAEMTVNGAIGVAHALGIEESFIAIVVIGLGTSLPELSISVGAAIRNRSRMSVGNLVGSNIFDMLVPVGAAAAISGISFHAHILRRELPFLFVLTFVVLVFFVRKRGIQKGEAVTIVALYVAYVLFKLLETF